jgi:glycosyltransferase involved in cell wall biosynthesis
MIHDAQVFLTPQSYSPAFRAFYRFALPRIGASAVKILTVSDYSRNELARFGVAPHSKIEVVHNGADHILSCQADPSIVARLGLEPYRYVVGLANTQVHKNISVLLKALALPAMKSARLVLVGNANKDDFEKLGHHVPANVLFAGPVSDEQLRALMEGAAALAFPSTTEGFGLPPAEAMHLGCPVVAAPLGALPEICGDAAVYAEPHDVSAWSDAILGLIESHELRRKTSQSGYIQARKFTWAASARKLLNIVQDAILTDACGRTR